MHVQPRVTETGNLVRAGAAQINPRLSVDAETGARLGSLHMKTVTVTAEKTITWTIATGQERKRWKFLSAKLVDQLTMIGDIGMVATNSADV